MEKEVYSRINPHMKEAERCLRLKAYDFSTEDKVIAEKLFQKQKLLANYDEQARRNHSDILILENNTEIRSI
jgi:hypothetical protein